MMNPLAAVEAFHLEFLRALARSLAPSAYALKGGANLRFFFGSIRYSEDMDLDVEGPPVFELKDSVAMWDEMRLVVVALIEGGLRG